MHSYSMHTKSHLGLFPEILWTGINFGGTKGSVVLVWRWHTIGYYSIAKEKRNCQTALRFLLPWHIWWVSGADHRCILGMLYLLSQVEDRKGLKQTTTQWESINWINKQYILESKLLNSFLLLSQLTGEIHVTSALVYNRVLLLLLPVLTQVYFLTICVSQIVVIIHVK